MVFVKIRGDALSVAYVDHEGEVVEAFVTKIRARKASLEFMRKLMKCQGDTEAIVTCKLRSYRAAIHELDVRGHQQEGRLINTRAENSHQPFRRL